MSLYSNLKVIFKRFKTHTSTFVSEVREITKKRITTAEEAKERLRTTASVQDMIDISRAVNTFYGFDGEKIRGMASTEYTKYEIGDSGHRIIYLNGQKNDFLADEEQLKVDRVLCAIADKEQCTAYCIRNYGGHYQYFVLHHEGMNGPGDFVDDDMKNVVNILDNVKKAGAVWRSITDMSNDIVDDVSCWVISFIV